MTGIFIVDVALIVFIVGQVVAVPATLYSMYNLFIAAKTMKKELTDNDPLEYLCEYNDE
jgi:uncharacterized protein YneF (UPF0154 family)